MHTKLTNHPVEQVIAAIQALDLDPIKLKLMDPVEGHGWSREYADRMELAYKRFLILSVTYREETLAPSKDVDRFWHGHILDTLKYAEDCEKVFGYFLHHFPYFGMRGAEDAANLAAAAERTRQLYQQEFGSSESKGTTWCGEIKGQSAAWCGEIKAQSAWCGEVKAESAWCGEIKAQSAWCGEVKAESAWCGEVKAQSAWCGEVKAQNAAWCGEIKPQSAAWCGELKFEKVNDGKSVAAWPPLNKLNPSVRPTLSSV